MRTQPTCYCSKGLVARALAGSRRPETRRLAKIGEHALAARWRGDAMIQSALTPEDGGQVRRPRASTRSSRSRPWSPSAARPKRSWITPRPSPPSAPTPRISVPIRCPLLYRAHSLRCLHTLLRSRTFAHAFSPSRRRAFPSAPASALPCPSTSHAPPLLPASLAHALF